MATDDLIRIITHPGQRCAHCGLEAIGYGTFNGERYCHHKMRDCLAIVCPPLPIPARKARKR